jgi:hypothetical protein
MIGAAIALTGLVTGVFVLPVLSRKWDRTKSFNEACLKFRSSFYETMAELSSCKKDLHYVMSKSKANQDASIIEFRIHIPKRRQLAFDKAVSKFQDLRSQLLPAVAQYYQAKATGQAPTDRRPLCERLLESINNVLSFANPR